MIEFPFTERKKEISIFGKNLNAIVVRVGNDNVVVVVNTNITRTIQVSVFSSMSAKLLDEITFLAKYTNLILSRNYETTILATCNSFGKETLAKFKTPNEFPFLFITVAVLF